MSLREVTVDDLPAFFDQQCDPIATEMAEFPARSEEAYMSHWAKTMSHPMVTMRTVVADNQIAGNVVSFDYEGRREVGYWIGSEFWGRGIATFAVATFIVIETTRPLFAGVAAHNAGSIRVLEKCGFVRRGEQVGQVDLRLEG